MASPDLAIYTLLDTGLRNRNLDKVLASNCVVDWFGRTFIGQRRITEFYQNSNSTYEHAMTTVISTEAFEERPYHLLTREQPLENSERIPDVSSSDEQWFDCETHSPVNLKKGRRTPTTPIYISTPSICPGAPVRPGHSYQLLSDDDLDDVDSDDLDETGVRPLDSSYTVTTEKPAKEPKAKRLRREEKHETITTAESRFSDLRYLEATGTVSIKRNGSAMDEPEKRDCKMLVSYRVLKKDSSNIQIALIVYKSNTKTKTRRKLLFQPELHEPSSMSTHSSTSRSRTEEKDKKKYEERVNEISTAPPGVKYAKATKRPSKTSLRF